jgi:hypothetical protein
VNTVMNLRGLHPFEVEEREREREIGRIAKE